MLLSSTGRRLAFTQCRRASSGSCSEIAFRVSKESYDSTVAESLSVATRSKFWLDVAREEIDWFNAPTTALAFRDDSDKFSSAIPKWFPDGTTNLSLNALDRHVENGLGDRVALAYHSTVGGNTRDITYAELLEDVKSFAGALQELGVEAGDRVRHLFTTQKGGWLQRASPTADDRRRYVSVHARPRRAPAFGGRSGR